MPSARNALSNVKVTAQSLQEAKQPDAVLVGATSLFDWLVERKALVGGIFAAVVVAAGIGAAVSSSNEAKRHAAGEKLANVVTLDAKPVGAAGDAADADKGFATKDEKTKAVSEALDTFLKENAGTSAASTASLLSAQRALADGKADEAIAGFEAALKGSSGLGLFATEGLGYAHEAKGDLAKAGETFAKLTGLGAPGRATYHKARLLQKQGKTDEARKAYEEVVANHEKEIVASDARTRLDLLSLPPTGVGGFDSAAEEAAAEAEQPARKAKRTGTKE